MLRTLSYVAAWWVAIILATIAAATGFLAFAIVAVPMFAALMQSRAGDFFGFILLAFLLAGTFSIIYLSHFGTASRMRPAPVIFYGSVCWFVITLAFMFRLVLPERYYKEASRDLERRSERMERSRQALAAEGARVQKAILANIEGYVPHQPEDIVLDKLANGDYKLRVLSSGNLAAHYVTNVTVYFLSEGEEPPPAHSITSHSAVFRPRKGSTQLEPGRRYLDVGRQESEYILSRKTLVLFRSYPGRIFVRVDFPGFAGDDSLLYGNVLREKMKRGLSVTLDVGPQ